MGLPTSQLRSTVRMRHDDVPARSSLRIIPPGQSCRILGLSLMVATLIGCLQHAESTTDGGSAIAPTVAVLPIGPSGLPTIEMSESEFESWLGAREQLAELLPALSLERRVSQLPPLEEGPYKP